jgi:hypothetical protein
MTTGPAARLIENAATGLAKPVEGGGEIVHAKGNMVQTGSALLNEFRDGGIGGGRFEQFDAGRVRSGSGGQHGNVYLFHCHRFGVDDGHAEGLLVKPQAFVEAANGNSQVIDFNGHEYFS